MTLDELIIKLEENKYEENPEVMVQINGDLYPIEEIGYNEEADCLVISTNFQIVLA